MSGPPILLANALYYGTFIAINVLKSIFDSQSVQNVNKKLFNSLLTESKLGETIQKIANTTTSYTVNELMSNITTASGLVLSNAIINSGGNRNTFNQKLPETCLHISKEIYKILFDRAIQSMQLESLTVSERPDKNEILQNLTQVCINSVQDSISEQIEKSIFQIPGKMETTQSSLDTLKENFGKAFKNFQDATRNFTHWIGMSGRENLVNTSLDLSESIIEVESLQSWKSYIVFIGLILFFLLPFVIYFYKKYMEKTKAEAENIILESDINMIADKTKKLVKKELKNFLLHKPTIETVQATSIKKSSRPKHRFQFQHNRYSRNKSQSRNLSRLFSRRFSRKLNQRPRRSFNQKYRQIRSTI
jgi:hypothetical protein